MTTVPAVLILAGVVGGLWLWGKAARAMSRGVNRAVFARSNNAALDAVQTVITYTAPVAADRLMAAAVETVNAYAEPPALVPGLYVQERTAGRVVFAFGSKAAAFANGPIITIELRVWSTSTTSSDTTATSGAALRTLTWLESSGLVNGADQVRRVQERVTRAVSDSGGSRASAASAASTGV